MHSIKTKKMRAAILKVDLVKSYDRVDWNFLRLILLQIGFLRIMGCISSANFVVLVNGVPTPFFRSS